MDEAGLELKLDSLELLKCLRPFNSGMVQFEVNSRPLLSTLRPRILAIVLRKKTQARSMTAVTEAETRLRLLRGNVEAHRKSASMFPRPSRLAPERITYRMDKWLKRPKDDETF